MCLPDFKELKQIDESNPIIGYRNWINVINNLELCSIAQIYTWQELEGPHEVKERNSGIYAYNYYNYHNNYNNLSGIIHQWGKVAIHSTDQRSEYAKIVTLFTIRESDARGSKEFKDWIGKFNQHIKDIAKKYNCNTIHYQYFIDSQNKGNE